MSRMIDIELNPMGIKDEELERVIAYADDLNERGVRTEEASAILNTIFWLTGDYGDAPDGEEQVNHNE